MNTIEERMIKIFNQIDCPKCGEKLQVHFNTIVKNGASVSFPISDCCQIGSQYVIDNYQRIYNEAIAEEARDIFNF